MMPADQRIRDAARDAFHRDEFRAPREPMTLRDGAEAMLISVLAIVGAAMIVLGVLLAQGRL